MFKKQKGESKSPKGSKGGKSKGENPQAAVALLEDT
jgi:hypothetical protein